MMRVRPLLRVIRCCTAAAAIVVSTATVLPASEPLHTRIDAFIEAAATGPIAPAASDGEFLRRLHLDFAGRIPTANEARAFLDSTSPDKRTAAIDGLLASSVFAQHMATTFDVMLMERRGETHIKQPEWWEYLYASFLANKPYDVLVREILSADGTDEKNRAAARFYLDREGEANLLTRDVGRIFFGRDLQCAQCHDHPIVDDYLQTEYYGLNAFFSRSFIFTDKDKKTFFAEKADGVVKYQSVFVPDSKGHMRPALPGEAELVEPFFARGDEYTIAPAENIRPVPKYSRRAKLAELATSGNNRAFNRNIVNRLWAHMMGRGLVEPVDLLHPANPPSHPEVLDLLADEFVRSKFDIKGLMREIALTKAYARSVDSPEFESAKDSTQQLLAALNAKLAERSSELEKAEAAAETVRSERDTAKSAVEPVLDELTKARDAQNAAVKPAEEASKALAAAQQQLNAKQEQAALLTAAAESAQRASAALGNSDDIKTATAQIQSRTQAVAAEVPAIQKVAEEKNAAAKSAGDALAAADAQVASVAARTSELYRPLDEAEQKLVTAEASRRDLQTSKNILDRRLESSNATVALATAIDQEKAAIAAQTEAEGALAQLQTQIAQRTADRNAAAAELTTAQAAIESKNAEVATKQTALAERESVAKLINEAAVSVETAASRIQDADLIAAANTIQSRAGEQTQLLATERSALAELEASVKTAAEAVAATSQKRDEAEAQLATAQSELGAREQTIAAAKQALESTRVEVDSGHQRVMDQLAQQFAVYPLSSLTPEQLAWSVMQASGVVAQYRAAAETEIKTAEGTTAEDTPEKIAPRTVAIEKSVHEKLKASVVVFINLFGGGAAQPQQGFFATVDQALFFSNGGTVRSWLTPGGSNLTNRLVQTADVNVFADELYLSVLTRRPTQEEIATIAEYLEKRPNDRAVAVQELAWALMTSTEFRFKH